MTSGPLHTKLQDHKQNNSMELFSLLLIKFCLLKVQSQNRVWRGLFKVSKTNSSQISYYFMLRQMKLKKKLIFGSSTLAGYGQKILTYIVEDSVCVAVSYYYDIIMRSIIYRILVCIFSCILKFKILFFPSFNFWICL